MEKFWGAAVALGMAAALAGCSGGDGGGDGGNGDGSGGDASSFAEQPAQEIVETAQAAMLEVPSVHVDGEMTTDGEATTIDMRTSAEGDCTGTLDAGDAGHIEILGTGGEVWFKTDDAFLANFPAEVQQLASGKWIVDTDGAFTEFCQLEQLMDQMVSSGGGDEGEEKAYQKVGTEELDGEQVVKIEQQDEEDGVSHAYIQAGGDHLFLKVERSQGENVGAITFSEFGDEVVVQAPADDETVNLDQIG